MELVTVCGDKALNRVERISLEENIRNRGDYSEEMMKAE